MDNIMEDKFGGKCMMFTEKKTWIVWNLKRCGARQKAITY